MANTPLLADLQRAAARAAGQLEAEGSPDAGASTRRTFLGRSGALAAATLTGALPAARPAHAASAQPRIVVVGAGLAGLVATYRLQQAGYQPQLFEASDRAGGRCWTIRGAFADGQIAEHGRELIDQGHTAVRKLANELGLRLDNLLAAQPNGTEDFYFFDGGRYSFADATNDLKGIW